MKGIKIEGPKVKLTGRKPRTGRRPTAYATRQVKGQDGQQPQVVVVQDGPRRLFRRGGRGPEPLPVYVTDPTTGHDQQRPRWDYKGSTLWRNGRLLAPWAIPGAVVAVSGVLQLAATIGDLRRGPFAGAVLVAALVVALIAARIGAHHLDNRWKPRIYAWAIIGPTWLLWTVADGITLLALALLLLATAAVSARWWTHYGRRDAPTRPPAKPKVEKPAKPSDAPPAEDDIIGNLIHYGDRQGGPCKDWRFENPDITEERSRWDLLLPPGTDSLDKVYARQDLVATAARRHAEDLIIEKHPTSKDSSRIRFTVVTRSPVVDGVDFTEPRWIDDEDGNANIELGTYSDGDGTVLLPIISDHTSAENALIVANRGGGKSTLLLGAAVTARSSGRALLIYLDGKGGASSPVLMHWADWAPVGATRTEILQNGLQVLTMLETLLECRKRYAMKAGQSSLTPTPDLPIVTVIIDECHVIFGDDAKIVQRWTDLLREVRAFGIVVWAATQGTKVNSFGNESDIKEFLGGNTTIVGRLRSGQAQGLLRVAYDPSTLPQSGGWFYIDSRDGRSAQWRGRRLRDVRSGTGKLDSQADEMLARYPGRTLETESLRDMPEFYTRRTEIAEEARRRLHSGTPKTHVKAQEPVKAAPTPAAQVGGWNPEYPTLHAVPSPAAPSMPAGLTGRQQDVWTEVAAGRGTVTEICDGLDLAKTRVYEILTDLRDAGHVRPVDGARGRYEVTTG